MDVEARLLDLMSRMQALEAGTHTSDARKATTAEVAQIRADIAEFRIEVSQDLAALGDEMAGLRRHLNEYLSSVQSKAKFQPGSL
ncbi:hypothetical protein ACFPOI_09235 [Nonomuraea angiospora]|uniref:Ribosome-interacting GTPase 1 n=1 Tax=Nonomuraea angiospora TaxID=46172 RepID=A0ABR9M9F7_9ACTN|nr:hypothetical protein [Nonomuraea angiospora]MBE1589549.1 ribosome-interacting GTPase 1 [Nonomuraea angiospora]